MHWKGRWVENCSSGSMLGGSKRWSVGENGWSVEFIT